MPAFFFFNQDVANLFAGGNNGPPAIRYRDLGLFFPALLLMGSLSGAPQLVLPLGLYILLGQVNVDNALGSSIAKMGSFLLITILMFWDFIPSMSEAPLEEEQLPISYRFEEPREEGIVLSVMSEMSLVFLISLTLAVLSHWEEIHGFISRSLPRVWSRRFREFTQSLGLHPASTSSGLSPATPEAIASFETVQFREIAQGDCSICLEAFKVGEVAKKLPCKHLFHTPCLMPWLTQRSSCPVCRSSVEQEETSDTEGRGFAEYPQGEGGTSPEGDDHHGVNAVWNALRSIVDPIAIFNPHLQVEDRDALMHLSIRELRDRARARHISLEGVVEKREIVDLLLNDRSQGR